jgi:hypothetical protein
LEDRRILAKSVAEQLGFSRKWVGSIIHEDLEMLVACFLPGRAKDLSAPLYGAENWKLQGVDKKYVENFGMWCWRRMEKFISTDCVRNEVEEERNMTHTIKRRKANWIGQILHRNCPLKHVTEEKMGGGGVEIMGIQGRRCKQLLNDFKGVRGYWKLKEAALGCILENLLWKKLWTSRKTDYRINERMND